MTREKIETFILENLFNKDNVLYNSKGIDITGNRLSDHIEQVNRDGLLILRRAYRSIQQTKETANRTSEDLRQILKRKQWPTTSEGKNRDSAYRTNRDNAYYY